jgi:hypothetical protein
MSFDAGPAIQALQAWYQSNLGLYHWDDPSVPSAVEKLGTDIVERFQDTERWWNSANATGTLIDYMAITGDTSNLSVITSTFTVAQGTFSIDPETVANDAKDGALAGAITGLLDSAGNPLGAVVGGAVGLLGGGGGATAATLTHFTDFINPLPTGFYDDEGWWAETWIKAFDLTQDPQYLTTAQTIFKDMVNGWDTTYEGGGIWWEKNHEDPNGNAPYKNAIANELFFAVAARLYVRTGDPTCLGWAKQACAWFLGTSSGWTLTPQPSTAAGPASLVQDSPNDSTYWTYNQGVILGALSDWYAITGDDQYLSTANAIANGAIAHFGKPGVLATGFLGTELAAAEILTENGDPSYDPDHATFKGPFIRNLAKLYLVTRNEAYATFIADNAAAVLAGANASHQLGARWGYAPDATDFCRQTAAIDALNAGNRVLAPISLKAAMMKAIGSGITGRTISVRGLLSPGAGVQRGTFAARSVRACIVAATT